MFIHVQKSGKFKYVTLRESFVKDGKHLYRVVKRLGKLDQLEAENKNALQELKEKYNNTELQRDRKLEQQLKVAKTLMAMPSEQNDLGEIALPPLNYGLFPLWKIWHNDLSLDLLFDYLRKNHTKVEFDVGRYIFFLSMLKVIDPQSILSSFETSCNYAGDWLNGCKLDELYRSYEFLCDEKDSLLSLLNRRLDRTVRANAKPSMVFYDVTNVYFETFLSDEEKGYLRQDAVEEVKTFLIKALREQRLNGVLNDFLDLSSPDHPRLVLSALPNKLYRELKELMFLRMRGPSKEHRFDLPLVSIALVIDELGFPIDFQVFPGNASEYKTMRPTIESMRRKYQVKDLIVMADRGLNSADNLQMLLDHNLGFLVAQKVTILKNDELEKMLDEKGYVSCKDSNGNEIWRYKAIEHFKKQGPKGQTNIDCTLVVSYSEDRYKRDLAVLERDWEKAEAAVNNQSDMGKTTTEWSRLVIRDSKTPKAKAQNQIAYEKRLKLCGYSAVVYHACPNSQRHLTADEIAHSYHRLERIEETFRAMKNDLSLRPMYVYNDKHIVGHVTVCILALLMLRMLERRLKDHETPLSVSQISNALNGAEILPVYTPQNKRIRYYNASRREHMRLTRDQLSSKALCHSELVSMIKKQPSAISQIMNACDLHELPSSFDRIGFSKCVEKRFASDQVLIGEGFFGLIKN